MLFVLLFSLPALLILIDFLKYFVTGARFTKIVLFRVLESIAIIFYPLLYIYLYDMRPNDCCSDSATFAPEHRLTIYLLIAIFVIAYIYSTFSKKIKSPLVEFLVNSSLVSGIILNVFISIHIEQPLWLLGNLPIVLLFVMQLRKNHNRFLDYSATNSFRKNGFLYTISWKLLELKPIYKYPLLLVAFLPLFAILTSLLMLFGQQPDSAIRAFTDTYKHGFSQLDYMCENVYCGGHFLCSVAAGGHRKIVHPQRLGERHGKPIICNRQLLVANAFENLIETTFPVMHQYIRSNYNKVGEVVHKYYWIFENQYVADTIYILMKPLEWIFLLVLYVFDQNPENRIARQYLKPADQLKLKSTQNPHSSK